MGRDGLSKLPDKGFDPTHPFTCYAKKPCKSLPAPLRYGALRKTCEVFLYRDDERR
jgi:hypothetical protein